MAVSGYWSLHHSCAASASVTWRRPSPLICTTVDAHARINHNNDDALMDRHMNKFNVRIGAVIYTTGAADEDDDDEDGVGTDDDNGGVPTLMVGMVMVGVTAAAMGDAVTSAVAPAI